VSNYNLKFVIYVAFLISFPALQSDQDTTKLFKKTGLKQDNTIYKKVI